MLDLDPGLGEVGEVEGIPDGARETPSIIDEGRSRIRWNTGTSFQDIWEGGGREGKRIGIGCPREQDSVRLPVDTRNRLFAMRSRVCGGEPSGQ